MKETRLIYFTSQNMWQFVYKKNDFYKTMKNHIYYGIFQPYFSFIILSTAVYISFVFLG